jgi:hypothetical protein
MNGSVLNIFILIKLWMYRQVSEAAEGATLLCLHRLDVCID